MSAYANCRICDALYEQHQYQYTKDPTICPACRIEMEKKSSAGSTPENDRKRREYFKS